MADAVLASLERLEADIASVSPLGGVCRPHERGRTRQS